MAALGVEVAVDNKFRLHQRLSDMIGNVEILMALEDIFFTKFDLLLNF